MSLKPTVLFKELTDKMAHHLNRVIADAYRIKVESLYLREPSGVFTHVYQSTEHGSVLFSATGSANVTITYALQQKQNKIIYTNAHAVHSAITARIVDITKTSISIQCAPNSGDFSDTTNGQVRVYYKVQGSNP